QVRDAPIFFGVGREILIPYSKVERQVGADPPVVRDIGVVNGAAEVRIRVAEAHRTRLRQPQQKIGEIETSARQGLAVRVKAACQQAAEAESAAAVLVGAGVELHAPVFAAGCNGVSASHE